MSVDIRTLTLRQLIWMIEGRDRFAWSLASSMMALIANCHKGKGRALTANDFNPTLTKEERMRDAILITDENVELIGVGKIFGIVATAIVSVAKIALGGFRMISGAISLVTATIGTVVSAFSGVATLIGAVFSGVVTVLGTAFSVLATVGTTVFGMIGTAIAAAFSPLDLP